MTEQNQSRQPTHRLYVVKGEGQNARWTEIGAAWPNKGGNGFALRLDAFPFDGRIIMRAVQEGGAS